MNYRKIVMGIVVITLLLGVSISSVESMMPPREETIIISAAMGVPPGWNPVLAAQAWGNTMMYPSLFFYNHLQERWIPYLAEGFRWVDEFTLEVTLRPEAKWWDGVPITAGDVQFTWELARRHVIPAFTPVWAHLEEVRVVDDRTVQFVTSEEKLNYFALIGVLDEIVIPRHRWKPLEAEYGARLTMDFRDDDPAKIIGGGPYRLHRWTTDIWTYLRVDDWWGKDIFGLPYPKHILHKAFKDNLAANLAFTHLELDVMTYFTPAVWELWEVKGLPARTYFPEPPFYMNHSPMMLYISFARPPLDNPVIRRAIAWAIPFEDLIDKAYFGYSIRAHPSMLIHTAPGADKWIDNKITERYGYHFNLERARELLDEAGIIDRDEDGIREMPDGTRLGPWTIKVPHGWTDWMAMSDMIAHNLRGIGLDVRAVFPDFTVWDDRVVRGQFDLIIRWSAAAGFDHSWNVFRMVMDPRLTGPVGEVHPAGNWQRYMNREVEPLIDAIAREADPERLKEYFRQLQKIAMRDIVAIPLFYGAVWYLFAEHIWEGWPRAEYPDRWGMPIYAGDFPSALPLFFGLVPRGEDPMLSAWETRLRPLEFSTDDIWEALGQVLGGEDK